MVLGFDGFWNFGPQGFMVFVFYVVWTQGLGCLNVLWSEGFWSYCVRVFMLQGFWVWYFWFSWLCVFLRCIVVGLQGFRDVWFWELRLYGVFCLRATGPPHGPPWPHGFRAHHNSMAPEPQSPRAAPGPHGVMAARAVPWPHGLRAHHHSRASGPQGPMAAPWPHGLRAHHHSRASWPQGPWPPQGPTAPRPPQGRPRAP